MRLRFLVLVLCVACNSKSSQPEAASAPPASPAPPPSAAAAEPSAPQPAPAEEARPETKPIDPAKAKSYVAYQNKLIPLQREWIKMSGELNANAKQGKYDGVVGTAQGYQDMKNKGVPLAEKFEKIRKEAGITEDELSALSEISGILYARNDELKNRLDTQAAEMEKAIAGLPESEREEATKALTEVKDMRTKIFELKEVRAKFGNGIVDAMIAQEAVLKRQNEELRTFH